jgi:hypothetical protein
VKYVTGYSNSSEIQLDDAVAVKMIVEGTDFDLCFTLNDSIHQMANNKENSFTLGHRNLITALCQHNKVPEYANDLKQYPIRALTIGQFQGYDKKTGPQPAIPANDEDEAEEMNRFESGTHPQQQMQHSDDDIAALMTQLAIAKACHVPHTYYSEESSLYQAAMARMSEYPPSWL